MHRSVRYNEGMSISVEATLEISSLLSVEDQSGFDCVEKSSRLNYTFRRLRTGTPMDEVFLDRILADMHYDMNFNNRKAIMILILIITKRL